MEVDVDVKAIDLTNEEVNNERQITTHHDKICGDLGVIDLTQEKNNVVDERYARSGGDSECLKEKYAREKAERPIRNEMRQYRIYLWFRDWELYKNNQSRKQYFYHSFLRRILKLCVCPYRLDRSDRRLMYPTPINQGSQRSSKCSRSQFVQLLL